MAQQFVRPDPTSQKQPSATTHAVVVIHGMGQQIAYETLNYVTDGLRGAEQSEWKKIHEAAEVEPIPQINRPDPRVEFLRTAENPLRRVALTLTTATLRDTNPPAVETAKHEVHLYEAYWAPKTEGRVTLGEVIAFLARAATNGAFNSFKQFNRYMFGQFRRLTVVSGTLPSLILALVVVGSIVVLNTIIVGVAFAHSVFGAAPGWFSQALLNDLTAPASVFTLSAISVGATLALAIQRRGPTHEGEPLAQATAVLLDVLLAVTLLLVIPGTAITMIRLVRAHRATSTSVALYDEQTVCHVRATATLIVLLTLALVVVAWAVRAAFRGQENPKVANVITYLLFWIGVLIAFYGAIGGLSLLFLLSRGSLSWNLLLSCNKLPSVLSSTFWLWPFLAIIASTVRRILVEYVGDVAIYVSPHKLDKFNDLRDEIQNSIEKVLRAVYAAEGSGKKFFYDRVVVVGHSLGSVIGYDVLNRLIVRDEVTSDAKGKLDVLRRTEALITFGSPLDKIAFIFAVQGSKTSETREAIVALGQPLIWDYEKRTFPWVNVYSSQDIIGGRLDYFDKEHDKKSECDDFRKGGKKCVRDVNDREATIPLVAHTEHWRTKAVWTELYNAISEKQSPRTRAATSPAP